MYLNEGELAAALVAIGDGHLSILVHPPLTPKHIVNARGHLLPLVMVFMSTSKYSEYQTHACVRESYCDVNIQA